MTASTDQVARGAASGLGVCALEERAVGVSCLSNFVVVAFAQR